MKKSALKVAFRDTLPVMAGYLFLGSGFGILLRQQTGLGTVWSVVMALCIFAGSAQYMLVGLLAAKASLLSVAFATLLLNARHLFYGISLVDRYKDAGKKKPYLIFALTDETYSLVTQNTPPEGISRLQYCFLVALLDHIYWVCGCLLGGLAGRLPIDFSGVEFVLTALFVTMFVEQWLSNKSHRPAIIGVGCTVMCLLIFGSELFLIPSMVLIAGLLLLMKKTGRRQTDE